MNNEYFDNLESIGLKFTEEQKVRIVQKLNERLSYSATIGVFGKTGAGKSSLCNALFGMDLYPIDDVEACTRNPQEELLKIGNGKLKVLDVPGVGENNTRDEEYAELYNSIIPQLDLIVWVIKADDRALVSDERFFKHVVSKYINETGKPFIVALNQVDKVEPHQQWNLENHQPGIQQELNIDKKICNIAELFNIDTKQVVAVSVAEQYRIADLMNLVICSIPNEKVVTVAQSFDKAVLTQDSYLYPNIQDAIECVEAEIISEEMPDDTSATPSTAMKLVSKITDFGINGSSSLNLSSAKKLYEYYLSKGGDRIRLVDDLISNESIKSASSGFITGLGGLITLPITIPADMLATWVIAARMSAAISEFGDYNSNDDSTKSMILASLCGNAGKQLVRQVVQNASEKMLKEAFKRVPAQVLRNINKIVGIKLITKAGEKSLTSLAKLVPILGGIIGAGVDYAYNKSVGKVAKDIFLNK